MDAGEKQLLQMGLYPELQVDVWRLPVTDSRHALHILNALEGMLDFELIKNSMDDVFLKVTKKKEGFTI